MTVWEHSRNARIECELVRDDSQWAKIRLTSDHQLRYYSESARGHTDRKGEIITVRTALLKKVAA